MNLLSPWNLIFLLPAGIALLYLLMLATGTVSAHGGDVDADADADVHVEVDVDADVDADADAGVDNGVEHAAGNHGQGGAMALLSVLGIGRVPLSLIVMSFCFLWGFLGWAGNLVFGGLVENDAVAFLPSLALALIGATTLTRGVAVGLGRILPSTETYVVSHRGLVGRLASVRYAVTEQSGTAQVYDEWGGLHEVPVRVRTGEPPIPSGREVVLWSFNADEGVYYVLHDPDLESVAPRNWKASAHRPGHLGAVREPPGP